LESEADRFLATSYTIFKIGQRSCLRGSETFWIGESSPTRCGLSRWTVWKKQSTSRRNGHWKSWKWWRTPGELSDTVGLSHPMRVFKRSSSMHEISKRPSVCGILKTGLKLLENREKLTKSYSMNLG